MLWVFIFTSQDDGLQKPLWERPCVAKGPRSGPGNLALEQRSRGRCAALSRHKAAPTRTAFLWAILRIQKCREGHPWGTPRGIRPYWQASQSGSSIAQAFGTGAGPAAWTGALSPPLETALSLPVLMVDFSVLVAARARR